MDTEILASPATLPDCTEKQELVVPKRHFLVLWLLATTRPDFFRPGANSRWTLWDPCTQTTIFDPNVAASANNSNPLTAFDWKIVEAFLNNQTQTASGKAAFSAIQNVFFNAANAALPQIPAGSNAYPDKPVCPHLTEVLSLLS